MEKNHSDHDSDRATKTRNPKQHDGSGRTEVPKPPRSTKERAGEHVRWSDRARGIDNQDEE